jgi:hypothetical protein
MEPWTDYLECHRSVVGYFSLLHSSQLHVLQSAVSDGRSHDDQIFANAFGPGKTVFLPIAVLHLGTSSVDWAGRISRLPMAAPGEGERGNKTALMNFARSRIRKATNEAAPKVLLIAPSGFIPAVDVHDWWNVSIFHEMRKPCAQWQRDQNSDIIENRWATSSDGDDLRYLENEAIKHSALEKVEAIIIISEPTTKRLFDLAPILDGAKGHDVILIGEGFSYARFPKATPAVELLLGHVDEFDALGNWVRRLDRNCALLSRGRPASESKDGVLICVTDKRDEEAALETLAGVRLQWDGECSVVTYGFDSDGLRIAAAKFGCSYYTANRYGLSPSYVAAAPIPHLVDRDCLECSRSCIPLKLLPFAPYLRSLLVVVGRPLLQNLSENLSRLVPSSVVAFCDAVHHKIEALGIARSEDLIRRISLALDGRELKEANDCESFLREIGKTERRASKANCPMPKLHFKSAFRSQIYVDKDWAIVSIVRDESDVASLVENWASINWPSELRRVVFVEKRIATSNHNMFTLLGVEIISMESGNQDPFLLAIELAANTLDAECFVILDPLLAARPGASLVPEGPVKNFAYFGSSHTFFRRDLSVVTCVRIEGPLTIINREWLIGALRRCRSSTNEHCDVFSFEKFATSDALKYGLTVGVFDPLVNGWGG